MSPFLVLAAIFVLSAAIAMGVTPLTAKYAARVGVVDMPGPRKVHTWQVPRLGGLAILVSFIPVAFFAAWFTRRVDSQVIGCLMGSAVVFVVGAVDDWRALSAWHKLGGQLLAALMALFFGIKVAYLSNPAGPGMILVKDAWAIPITIIWLVAITNAFNLIDGLDGLAAGVCAIASLTMAFMAGGGTLFVVAILASVLAGASLGFLYFNFNPAKIFLGDSGSYLIGYALACIAIIGAMKTPVAITVAMPLLLFAVPIFDTFFAVARRAFGRRPIMSRPDRGHLHHRLLGLGMSQRQVVLIIYAVSIIFCLIAFLLYVR